MFTGQLGVPWVRRPLYLMSGVPNGVSDTVSRIHVPLMSSESPISRSLGLYPLYSLAAHDSVLYMGETGTALLVAGFTYLCTHFSPRRESQASKLSIGTELCHFGEGMTQEKSNCSSYFLSNASKLVFFVRILYWNFTDNLDFHKASLTNR